MTTFNNILNKIISHKHDQLRERKSFKNLNSLKEKISEGLVPPLRSFSKSLRSNISKQGLAIIAELKKASPSKGLLCQNYSPKDMAPDYEKHGAACLSVLTETDFFLGSDEDLKIARNTTHLPILRKDFIIDSYQLYESRCLGADCVLLIVAALSKQQLQEYYEIATELNLEVLVEINTEEELSSALNTSAFLIGINNRNLKDFSVNLDRTISLAKLIPQDYLIVCESGIQHRSDIEYMLQNNLQSFLIGEALVKSTSPGLKLAELLGEVDILP